MATLIFYEGISYSRGWAVCHSPFVISSGPFQRSLATLPASVLFVSCGGVLSTGRGSVARFGRVCSTTGYITSGLRGPSPQALTLFGGVGFIARRLRRTEKGNADGVRGIFGTAYRVGLRPCDRTHLKNGLVPYSYIGGT